MGESLRSTVRAFATGSILTLCLLLLGAPARAVTWYSTDFGSAYEPEVSWAAYDNWLAIDPDNGTVGITSDGGAAYIGGIAPGDNRDYSLIYRDFLRDPVAAKTPIVKVTVTLAVVDPDATADGDAFFLVFYDNAGQLLSFLQFHNDDGSIAYFPNSSGAGYGLGYFEPSTYYTFELSIDYSTNRITVRNLFGGGSSETLLQNVPFHTGGRALRFGQLGFFWNLGDVAAPDNYLLVDALSVTARALPKISIVKGFHQRTTKSRHRIQGRQGAEDAVSLELRLVGQKKWSRVGGDLRNWKVTLNGLRRGKTRLDVRLKNVLGQVIDKRRVTITRR